MDDYLQYTTRVQVMCIVYNIGMIITFINMVSLHTLVVLIIIMFFIVANIQLNYDQEMRVTMKGNTAYEVISMSRQRVKMDTNPAYEEVQPHNMAQ